MKKEKKKDLDNYTNNRPSKKSPKDTTKKNYEFINIVSKTGDSICAAPEEDLSQGETFYSGSIIRKMIRKIVQDELVAAGVMVKSKNE
jgi:hypothetical protein